MPKKEIAGDRLRALEAALPLNIGAEDHMELKSMFIPPFLVVRDVPIAGHGKKSGGRRSSSLERRLSLQSGSVCYGDYCEVGLKDPVYEAMVKVSTIDIPFCRQEPLMISPLVQVTRADGSITYRGKECNYQIPYKSVLLARSEAKFLGKDISDTVNALWKIKQTIEVWVARLGRYQEISIALFKRLFLQLDEALAYCARRHLERVAEQCRHQALDVMFNSKFYQHSVWEAVNGVYRRLVSALSAICDSARYVCYSSCMRVTNIRIHETYIPNSVSACLSGVLRCSRRRPSF